MILDRRSGGGLRRLFEDSTCHGYCIQRVKLYLLCDSCACLGAFWLQSIYSSLLLQVLSRVCLRVFDCNRRGVNVVLIACSSFRRLKTLVLHVLRKQHICQCHRRLRAFAITVIVLHSQRKLFLRGVESTFLARARSLQCQLHRLGHMGVCEFGIGCRIFSRLHFVQDIHLVALGSGASTSAIPLWSWRSREHPTLSLLSIGRLL
mmetsp:Transcript_10555/g.24030  ORF Transcript_10555/g.24030 Transcript_10555/m.24030 type:complete len:205 (+) Transcript_10555:444-1058(+)